MNTETTRDGSKLRLFGMTPVELAILNAVLFDPDPFHPAAADRAINAARQAEADIMKHYVVYQLTDSGGWGSTRTDLCCVQARSRSCAKLLAMNLLSGHQLSTLSHWDLEEIPVPH